MVVVKQGLLEDDTFRQDPEPPTNRRKDMRWMTHSYRREKRGPVLLVLQRSITPYRNPGLCFYGAQLFKGDV